MGGGWILRKRRARGRRDDDRCTRLWYWLCARGRLARGCPGALTIKRLIALALVLAVLAGLYLRQQQEAQWVADAARYEAIRAQRDYRAEFAPCTQ